MLIQKSKTMRVMNTSLLTALGLAFVMASCSQPAEPADTGGSDQKTTPREQETQPNQSVADTVRLEIEGNDQMKYNKDRLTVKAGQVVVLTLKHVGELPKDAMGHNWVLLQKGADKAAFAEDAIAAKDNGYIPQGRTDDVIAHTKMLGGGESDEIIFEAPNKGIYSFLCSFPGHYMNMNGKFIVE